MTRGAEMGGTKTEEHSNRTAVATLVLEEVGPVLGANLHSKTASEHLNRNRTGQGVHMRTNVHQASKRIVGVCM